MKMFPLLGPSVECVLACGHFNDTRDAILGRAFSSSGRRGTGGPALLSDEAVLSHLHLTGVELGLNLIMILRPHLGIHRCRILRPTGLWGLW